MIDNKYPYTDFHELNLDWFMGEFKKLVEEWATVQADWTSLHDYVQNYFNNLNVQTEIDNKINAMILNGTFADIVSPFVTAALPALVAGQLPDVVAAQISSVVAAQISAVVADQLPAVAAAAAAQEVGTWLAAHIDPDTGYVIDNSLTVSQAAADAKTTGDRIGINDNILNSIIYVNLESGKSVSKTDGSVVTSTWFTITDYIPVLKKIGVLTFANAESSAGYFFYDENKNPIASSGGSIYLINNTWTVLDAPAGACYFRTTCLSSKITDLKVASDLTLQIARYEDNRHIYDEKFNSIAANGCLNHLMTLSHGGINTGTGANYNSAGEYDNTHIRTDNFFDDLITGKQYIVTCTLSGSTVNIFRYQSDGTYIGNLGFSNQLLYTAVSGEKIKIVFANSSNINESDIRNNSLVGVFTDIIKVSLTPVPTYSTPAVLNSNLEYTETSENAIVAQGICTDGTYIYIARQNSDSTTEIEKISVSDMQVYAHNSGAWGHVNDLCYDAANDYLLAIYTIGSNPSTLIRIDSTTLEEVDRTDLSSLAHSIDAQAELAAITYDDNIKRYIFAVDKNNKCLGYLFTDTSFNSEKFVKIIDTNLTAQNIDIYDGMIAATFHNHGNDGKIIYYDYAGNQIEDINAGYAYELEGVCHINDVLYLSYNASTYKQISIYSATATSYHLTAKANVLSQYNPN